MKSVIGGEIHDAETKPAISWFRGPYRWLSSMYLCPIEMGGIVYDSVEHAFQASKTFDDSQRLMIWAACDPGVAKKIGRTVTLRDDWEEVKYDVMLELQRKKFQQDPFKKKLLATDNAELIEGNNWRDTYWGMCDGVGENKLGKILMLIRKELRDVQT